MPTPFEGRVFCPIFPMEVSRSSNEIERRGWSWNKSTGETGLDPILSFRSELMRVLLLTDQFGEKNTGSDGKIKLEFSDFW